MKERLLDLAAGLVAIGDAALLGVLIATTADNFHHNPFAVGVAVVYGAFNAFAVAMLFQS